MVCHSVVFHYFISYILKHIITYFLRLWKGQATELLLSINMAYWD
jgi:hypothetical protein